MEKRAKFAAFIFIITIVAWARAQTLHDVPQEGKYPEMQRDAPMDPALRANVKNALKARDYTRAETLLVDEIDKHPSSAELLKVLGGIFF